jgi:DNA adenine methylase
MSKVAFKSFAEDVQPLIKQAPRSRKVSSIYLDRPAYEENPGILSHRGGKRIAFGWYGGKFSHLDWLLPFLPKCHHYCEPFSGSAAVLLNREPSPVETYNDIDGDVANFFRVLRNSPNELARALSLTPFSREEFFEALNIHTSDSQIEKARKFYVRARQARSGLAQTATLGRWANCKNTSRSGMSGVVSRWLGGVRVLEEIAERLIAVQIENRPALEIISLYDGIETLFYCDPPYLHATRGDAKAYSFEMSEKEHRALARSLTACRGKVVLSGYRHELMDELYRGWNRYDAPEKVCHTTKGMRQESIWYNF